MEKRGKPKPVSNERVMAAVLDFTIIFDQVTDMNATKGGVRLAISEFRQKHFPEYVKPISDPLPEIHGI